MKKILAMILAMVMALSLAACGKTEQKDEKKDDTADAKTFIMGIDAEYPPFSYIDENGEYTGFDVEVCKAACDLLELGSEAGAAGCQRVRLRLVRHDDPGLHEGGRLRALRPLL